MSNTKLPGCNSNVPLKSLRIYSRSVKCSGSIRAYIYDWGHGFNTLLKSQLVPIADLDIKIDVW